jgi:predicted Fe-Mo cluster-binding NifX family protein
MKVCFPVQSPQGLASAISQHFGTAPHFMVFDTDRQEPTAVSAAADGSCQCGSPLLTNLDVDAVVCGGIGAGALQRLTDRGIKVYAAEALTVGASLALLERGQLRELRESSCGDHGVNGHSCHAQ